MNLKYKCKNLGCHEQFLHSNQLTRHKKKCAHVQPPSNKEYIFSNNSYKCVNCPKTFSCQSNGSRHVKQGCKIKVTPVCKLCQKTFAYQSHLLAHMKVHKLKEQKVCQHCNKYFAWTKSFLKHKDVCQQSSTETDQDSSAIEISEEIFVPSMIDFSVQSSSVVPIVSDVQVDVSSSDSILPSDIVITVAGKCSKFNHTTYSRRKTRKNLEDIVQNLVSMKSPVKNRVANNYVKEIQKVITHSPAESVHEAIISTSLLDYLRNLNNNRKFGELHHMLHKLFGDHTTDTEFMSSVAKKLGITHVKRFFDSAQKWSDINFNYSAPSST